MRLFIIGEAGSNHLGDPERARELVRVAYRADCDAVKFQAFSLEEVWDQGGDPRAEWQREWFEAAYDESCRLGIQFMCTPFSVEQARRVDPYISRWKVSASHVGDKELLAFCRETGKDVFLSTAFLLPEVVRGYCGDWAIPLHCVHAYPAKLEDYALREWVERSGAPEWGLSDHSIGQAVASAAVALGALVVEKHFKLTNQPPSPDSGPHALDPQGLDAFVETLRQVEIARDGRLSAPVIRPGLKLWLPAVGGW